MENRTEIIKTYIDNNKDLRGFTKTDYNELVEEIELSLDNRNRESDEKYIMFTCDVIYDYFIESM